MGHDHTTNGRTQIPHTCPAARRDAGGDRSAGGGGQWPGAPRAAAGGPQGAVALPAFFGGYSEDVCLRTDLSFGLRDEPFWWDTGIRFALQKERFDGISENFVVKGWKMLYGSGEKKRQ